MADVLLGQPYYFRRYQVENGLSNNAVICSVQDSKGFLWIGTWEGLSKYDGNTFTNYTTANGLSHNLVNDFCELGNGRLFVAFNNGSIDEKDVQILQRGFAIRDGD